MAGDWIPVRVGLDRAIEVVVIARETGRSREEVMGYLLKLWFWVTDESRDGHARSVTKSDMVVTLGADEGFWSAVERAGWLELSEDGLVIPNWDRWNSRSAKNRLQAILRKRKQREEAEREAQDVTEMSRSDRDKMGLQRTEDRGQGTVEEKESSRTDWTEIAGRWNRIADKHGVPRIDSFKTQERKRRYRVLVAKYPDFWDRLEFEIAAMASKLKSGAWFSLWWIIKSEENYLNLVEGKYRNDRLPADPAGRRSSFATEGKFSDARFK